MKSYEEEKKINKERDKLNEERIKQDSKIMEGLKTHVKESNKKQDETNIKIDSVIRKLEK